MTDSFYVYQHRRNDTGVVFYVGKGKARRAWDKISRNQHWHGIANKYGHSVEILCDGLDADFAILLEAELIAQYGRRDLGTGPLVNLTDGGEGLLGISADTRRRIAQSTRGNTRGLGYRHTLEARERMSLIAMGKQKRLGLKHAEETIDKMKASHRLRSLNSNNKTGYRGVYLNRESGRFVARGPRPDGAQGYLGYFSTPEDAARAYDAAAIAAWGAGNCYLNFPAEHGLAA